MNILISTNMYQICDLPRVIELVNEFPQENLGVEIFAMFHKDEYEDVLNGLLDEFKKMPVTFHGTYYKTEHSKEKGTEEYERSMNYYMLTLKYAKELNSSYIVFHHNNCAINPDQKQKHIDISRENLNEINKITRAEGIEVVVENAGVISRRNMLFTEDEFIEECLSIDNPVLIDIGHANANGWNLKRVIEALKDKIIAYHVHNNGGYEDDHRRVYDGTNDFDSFLDLYREFTPNAEIVMEYDFSLADKHEELVEDLRMLCDFRKSLKNSILD